MKRVLVAVAAAALLLAGRWSAAPARWTFPQLPFFEAPLQASYIPTPIKSIQPVSITLNNVTSNTQTISAVSTANAILLWQGHTTNDSAVISAYVHAKGALTNSTTVTATAGATTAGVIQVWNGTVVEFIPQFVKSSQCSTIALPDGGTSATATITSVNTAKTMLVSTGESNVYTGSFTPSVSTVSIVLTNATTITATKPNSSGSTITATVGYCYIEFR